VLWCVVVCCCGTGKLKDYLGELFTYIGIDLSEKMLDEAKKRGFEVHRGPLEKVIKNFADRSVDHVVCVGVSGFVENLDGLVKEFLRVAKKSVLFAVEQLPEDLVTHMKEYRRIQIHNHPQFLLKTSTEQIKGVPFWRSEDGIVLADVYFQKLSE
jgi:ubiquinone/menaquinone biosynthesis C-methylase UbiE